MKRIETIRAPQPIGPYSQAIESLGFLFVSMQLPLDPKTSQPVSRECDEQVVQVCENIKAILEEAECTLLDCVKTTIYVVDTKDLPLVNEVYLDYFVDKPARSIVAVASLPDGAKVAMDVIAKKS